MDPSPPAAGSAAGTCPFQNCVCDSYDARLPSISPCSHLKDLLQDDARTAAMVREAEGMYMDFSRQNATPETLKVRGRFGTRFAAFLPLKMGHCSCVQGGKLI